MKNLFSSKIIVWTIAISCIASFLIICATVFAILAYRSSVEQSHKADMRAKTAAKQSYAACIRSKYISPILATEYEKHNYFTPEQAKFYRSTIPKECHK